MHALQPIEQARTASANAKRSSGTSASGTLGASTVTLATLVEGLERLAGFHWGGPTSKKATPYQITFPKALSSSVNLAINDSSSNPSSSWVRNVEILPLRTLLADRGSETQEINGTTGKMSNFRESKVTVLSNDNGLCTCLFRYEMDHD